MKKIEPYTLPGFIEYLPEQQNRFDYLLKVINDTYKKYGYQKVDTPIIHGADILLAKAGGETEKQIYEFEKGDKKLCLRFDQTVPLAKYVAQNYANLYFPFKAMQIGKSYRGERPQRGRFREFYQCDIDCIGEDELSVNYDSEVVSIISEIFNKIGLKFVVCINNRKILNGFFAYLNIKNKQETMRIVDKIDKIGIENVISELEKIGLHNDAINKIVELITYKGNNEEKLNYLTSLSCDNVEFIKGTQELKNVIDNCKLLGVKNLAIDFKISRGLDYYTGTVYETFILGNESVGSICSGGRYDNLADNYTDKKLPGVGISIGLSRLFFVLEDKNLIENYPLQSPLLVLPMGNEQLKYSLKVVKILRENDIVTDIYFNDKKFKAKLNYANKRSIRYVVIIGEEEEKQNVVTFKDMEAHTQEQLDIDEVIKRLKK